jgi:manganese/zinc/iron transport system permease protein
MTGVCFGAVFLLAPEYGLLAGILRRMRQRWEFALTMLTMHLFNHEGKPEAERESRLEELHDHLRWDRRFMAQVVRRAERRDLIVCADGHSWLAIDLLVGCRQEKRPKKWRLGA